MLKITVENGTANIYTPYNAEFVAAIKKLGGAKWSREGGCWKIQESRIPEVREVMRRIYGETDQETGKRVKVRLTFSEPVFEFGADVTILGKCLAHAWGRDSGATHGDDVSYISGGPESGGSAKNWTSDVLAGSVAILYDVPEALLSSPLPDGVEMEILEESVDRKALEEEKQRLLARLAEIDKLLAGE